MKDRKEISKIRRRNAKLYPIYKMFSWDLLFYYSIEFLFFTITKKVSAADILIITGFYLFFKIVAQMPAVLITELIGKRKSIILGNMLLMLSIILLIVLPGLVSIILANMVSAVGLAIKVLAESNLLYDSVSTRGGEGLYSKLESKGGSWYYILDGIASLTAGYLFVINNYLPMFICLGFIVISTIISLGFKDVYEVKHDKKRGNSLNKMLKEYKCDLKTAFKFVLKSKRMRAFVLFQIAFYSIIYIFNIYHRDLLVNIGIPEEQFSIIFAVLTLIGGISLTLRKTLEKTFKNRTLSVISLSYIVACIIIGAITSLYTGYVIIPIILVLYVIQKICTSMWYILEFKYLKNFTRENMRVKITFAYEFIGASVVSIFSILGGLLLKRVNVQNSILIVGLVSFVCMIMVLGYMKTRFGLKPEEYKKEDIEV